jgi:hypothetical protein
MTHSGKGPVEVLIVAVPETAGSALYGMLDVLPGCREYLADAGAH